VYRLALHCHHHTLMNDALPPCRWRGSEITPGTYACHSPKIMAPKGVTAATCQGCSLCDHAPPTVSEIQKVANFAAAMKRHMADRMRTVPEEEYQKRISICHSCPWFRDNTCTKCGCRLAGDKLAKARWASESCPLKKW
jgi:ferredoxin